MVLALPDKWVWDSWYVRDGDLWHAYFLQASKSLPDPEDRHWHVTQGHATSTDLVNWTQLGTCFAPADVPAWDDLTTWTGSVVKGEDGRWHLFYTGASCADQGLIQRIGHATSDDLHNWARVGDGLCLDLTGDVGAQYEADYLPGHWHDRAMRDPWVMRDPDGDGWLMYFTARTAGPADPLDAGAIGFATSKDLDHWTLEEPVFAGAAGQLEVPQVFEHAGRWFCLFCTDARFWAEDGRAVIGEALTGTHYLIADNPRGPWTLAPGPMLDGAEPVQRYAARILEDGGKMHLMGFRWFDPAGGPFIGEIADPAPVITTKDGLLRLSDAA